MRYNPAGAMSKPKTYLHLPEIPTVVPSSDLRGSSKALVLLGYRDCSYETHRYMVEVENMSEDDPVVLGLQQHLQQHWLRMDIQSLLTDVLDEASANCQTNAGHPVGTVGSGISNGTDSYCCSRDDSGSGGGDGSGCNNNVKEEEVSHRHHLCHRHPRHRRYRHHPHQRNHHHHHHQHNHQPCSQYPFHQQQQQNFVNALSTTELNSLNARVPGVSHETVNLEDESPTTDSNEKCKKRELQFKLTPVSSDIIVKAPQSSPSSSSSSEADKSLDRALLNLQTPNGSSTNNRGDSNNNNGINEINNNNDVILKEEDPERWKQLNLSIARVTQELIVLLENESSSLSDEDEGDYEEEEEEEEKEGNLIEDIDFKNILRN